MIEAEIKKRVKAHYKKSSEPLLLSQFGKALRVEGVWPVEGEVRSLRETIEALSPEVDVIRDPRALAYAVVVSKGAEQIAKDAIAIRHASSLLENLPRVVVLAFVAKAPEGQSVYLQIKPPVRYQIGLPEPADDYVEIEDKYRSPGLFLERVKDLPSIERERLSQNIRSWAEDHQVSLDAFYEKDQPSRNETPNLPAATVVSKVGGKSALERLVEAQPIGVAERMVVPADIALLLSRHH